MRAKTGVCFLWVLGGVCPWMAWAESPSSSSTIEALGAQELELGAAMEDITGPAAEVTMMGYGSFSHQAMGIFQRQFARAFVFQKTGSEPLAFVSADLGMIFQSVKLGVVERLQRALGSRFHHGNVMLTATHTHCAPGGFSYFNMYNLTSFGFVSDNYERIVSGISSAIIKADGKKEPGQVTIAEGDLKGFSANRSMPAYLENPEKNLWESSTNTKMTQLKLTARNGKELGAINWFAVHNTSLSNTNPLIGSDNKGYASWLFERFKNSRAPEGPFVAAFANSDEGDSTPNVFGGRDGRGGDEYAAVWRSGTAQFNKAWELYNQATEPIGNETAWNHSWVRMPGLVVTNTSHSNGTGGKALCKAGKGFSFAAGAEDGPGPDVFREGMRNTDVYDWGQLRGVFNATWVSIANFLLGGSPDPIDDPCQWPKPVLFATGHMRPNEWTPPVLPFQIFRLGSLALVAIPGEMTTMAGRRLRQDVGEILKASGVKRIVIAGLANTYSGYITTPEEYNLQHYEGASTHFGRLTFPAYQQEFRRVAQDMVQKTSSHSTAFPADLSNSTWSLRPGVVYDDKRIWESFGQVFQQPPPEAHVGEVVTVKFRSAHPRNQFSRVPAYAILERWTGNAWVSAATENDPELTYRWERDTSWDCAACSFAWVQWRVPADARGGVWRVRHRAYYKNGWNGQFYPIEGVTGAVAIR